MATTKPPEDRIAVIDVLRGFALLGVVVVNCVSYVNQQTPTAVLESSASPADATLTLLVDVLFEWKFMTLFSILFGCGFGILMDRLQRKGLDPVPFFTRRMSWLFVFGLLHTLFWWGDILHLYAVAGIMLLLFTKKSNRFSLGSAAVFLTIVPLCISWLFRNQPEAFTPHDIAALFAS